MLVCIRSKNPSGAHRLIQNASSGVMIGGGRFVVRHSYIGEEGRFRHDLCHCRTRFKAVRFNIYLFLPRLRGRCPHSGRRGQIFTAIPPSTHAFGVAHFPRKRGKNKETKLDSCELISGW